MDGATRHMTSTERRDLIAERLRLDEARAADERLWFLRHELMRATLRVPCVITVTHNDENQR